MALSLIKSKNTENIQLLCGCKTIQIEKIKLEMFVKIIDELKEKFGEQIILLCHEPVDEFCHRRLWVDFIELETGIYIPEVTVSNDGIVKKINPIRYKNRLKDVVNK